MFTGKQGGIAAMLALVITFSMIFTGCSKSAVPEEKVTADGEEGFAIYLTKEDVPPSQMEMLSHVELAEKPEIALDDIVSYDAGTHEIVLTEEAFARIAGLAVPTTGKSFLVCLDGAPVYWGAFWTPVSSQSFDGITIWMPMGSTEPVIQLKPGYPEPEFSSGRDERNNTAIMQSLKDAGKLINELPTTFIDELLKSFKGWELYSWQEDGEWQFRLITGTNRNKTPEEILAEASTTDGLMSIRVAGVERLLSVLAKLPEGEEVIWLEGHVLTAEPESGTKITLADDHTVSLVRNYAEKRGLKLAVARR